VTAFNAEKVYWGHSVKVALDKAKHWYVTTELMSKISMISRSNKEAKAMVSEITSLVTSVCSMNSGRLVRYYHTGLKEAKMTNLSSG
jgi:hypothetical protein